MRKRKQTNEGVAKQGNQRDETEKVTPWKGRKRESKCPRGSRICFIKPNFWRGLIGCSVLSAR